MGKQVITADEVQTVAAAGKKILEYHKQDCIVTPGAWDKIEELGLVFADETSSSPGCGIQSKPVPETLSGDNSA
ncbi:MAG: hypothetical protein LC657_08805, partial [Desulfobacteraceae bacterium]|nr:hypothetical protein [Desulfobacteraceae bacterium]